MREQERQELDELERELAPLFDASLPAGDPWQHSRMEAKAAEVPETFRARRNRLWFLVAMLASAGATATAVLVLLHSQPGPGGGDYQPAPPIVAIQAQPGAVPPPRPVAPVSPPSPAVAPSTAPSPMGAEANADSSEWGEGGSWSLQDDYMEVASLSLLTTPDSDLGAAQANEFYQFLLADDDSADDDEEEAEAESDDLLF